MRFNSMILVTLVVALVLAMAVAKQNCEDIMLSNSVKYEDLIFILVNSFLLISQMTKQSSGSKYFSTNMRNRI